MSSGVLLLDKASGLSSAAALARVKRKLSIAKIGHAGTLDPMASGLLVCLVNSATRLASFAQQGTKIYSGSIEFGLVTGTDDITGEILERSDQLPEFSQVLAATAPFVGNITQIPPRVSAIKIDGVRSYDRARNGEEFELMARPVRVDYFEVEPESERRVRFRIQCSKGTYIRSLARDLGAALGCGGCLASLRREATIPFTIDGAKTFENVSLADIMSWDVLFPNVIKAEVDDFAATRLLRGEKRALLDISERLGEQTSEHAIYYRQGSSKPLGLLRRIPDAWDYALNIGE
ncbi:MAG: tRNA pseudouridine(55) synthase TruB [Deltaproteobacteria bacterium]|nr:tRNA pseudouridine(55) synthase TruB [Deltaproteobacteria bacterium]